MNAGVTATWLIDCMAAMPWAGWRRARAFITKLEKAKTPAFSPQLSAVTAVSATSSRPSSCLSGGGRAAPDTGGGGVPSEVVEIPRRPAQGTLDAVAQVGVAAVQHLGEHVGQHLHVVGRDLVLDQQRPVVLQGDRQIPDRAADRGGDLGDRLRPAEQPRAERDREVRSVRQTMLWFVLVALLIGGFLVANAFSIMVAQRTSELALLRCLGATTGQVRN